ncbi:VanZ family protein [Neobacillus mesonae]|uniref:VanZ family protein n=1 Tax=Neobacillus mesonae TaxID=1193713 RepID=UPI00082F95AB|nr:VanZ family protein [Neobacillus mesonae]
MDFMLLNSSLAYLLGFIASLVYVIVQLCRRFFGKKELSLWRIFLFATFFIYISVVIGLTLFPIPVGSHLLSVLRGNSYFSNNNFIPFKSIIETASLHIRTANWYQLIRQLGGNLFLLFPLGIYLPLLFKLRFKTLLLLGIGSSLSIEMLQFLIGRMIQLNYRSIDVDDLILNSAGAVIGYLMMKYFMMAFFKKNTSLNEWLGA